MAPCPRHPEAEAVGACDRCGRFFCAPERIGLEGKSYCGECGVRDDVDWLGKHYRRYEGKRSGGAWIMLPLGVVASAFGVAVLVAPHERAHELAAGVGFLVFGLSCVALFTGRPGTRPALFLGAVAATLGLAIAVDPVPAFMAGLILFIIAASSWTDVATRLFYRVPVPRAELLKHFMREGNNPLAVLSSRLAFLGLFIPGVALVSLALAVLALTKVDAKQVPPVAGARIAMGAIVFSLFTLFIWAAALLPIIARG